MTLKPIAAAISVAIFPALAAQTQAVDLDFSKQTHTAQSAEINDQTIAYRAFENISYVKNPVEADYQTINIYIPEAYFHGGSINGYTAETAPIFLPNKIGGYMPARAGVPGRKGRVDASAGALRLSAKRLRPSLI